MENSFLSRHPPSSTPPPHVVHSFLDSWADKGNASGCRHNIYTASGLQLHAWSFQILFSHHCLHTMFISIQYYTYIAADVTWTYFYEWKKCNQPPTGSTNPPSPGLWSRKYYIEFRLLLYIADRLQFFILIHSYTHSFCPGKLWLPPKIVFWKVSNIDVVFWLIDAVFWLCFKILKQGLMVCISQNGEFRKTNC